MADCNIRNIDSLLMSRLKIRAAKCDESIKSCVLEAIKHWLDDHDRVDSQLAASAAKMEEWDQAFPRDKPRKHVSADIPVAPMPTPKGLGFKLKHAENCDCFICKPPKEK